MKRLDFYKYLLFIAISAAVISCAVNPVSGKMQIMLMSEADEVQQGLAYDLR